MKHVNACASLILALSFALFVGCRDHEATPASATPTVQMKLGSKTFNLEIANTESTREYGLMKRDSMNADHGMIFVFKEPTHSPFWMKNTRIPLDILYIDSAGKVLTIKQMKPYDLSPITSAGPYQWAIELNKGAAADAGVHEGDIVNIPDGARTARE